MPNFLSCHVSNIADLPPSPSPSAVGVKAHVAALLQWVYERDRKPNLLFVGVLNELSHYRTKSTHLLLTATRSQDRTAANLSI